MRETLIGKDNHLLEFDDILDLVEYSESGPQDGYSRCNAEKRVKFSGGTWEDAVKQAKTGNPELVKSFFDGVNVLNAMIEEEKCGEMRDVTGEYFDVAEYLSGEPECFRRDEMGERRQVVPVYANFAMNWRVSNEVIRNRGCGIIALCDELFRSGFIVDLRLVQCARGDWGDFDGKYYTSVKVGLDPLDLDTAAFIVANPLCHRRIFFGMLEHVLNKSECGGYGTPDEYDLSDLFDSGLSGFYFVSSNHSRFFSSNYRTLEATKRHVLKMIDEFKESAEQVIVG